MIQIQNFFLLKNEQREDIHRTKTPRKTPKHSKFSAKYLLYSTRSLLSYNGRKNKLSLQHDISLNKEGKKERNSFKVEVKNLFKYGNNLI